MNSLVNLNNSLMNSEDRLLLLLHLCTIFFSCFSKAVFVRELMEFLESGDLSMEYGLSRVSYLTLLRFLRLCFLLFDLVLAIMLCLQ